MSSSVWLAPNLVAGAGSDGVALFPLDRGETFALKTDGAEHPPPAEGIGAADDGSYVCSADRDGRAACWSNRPVAPTTYRPAAPLVR